MTRSKTSGLKMFDFGMTEPQLTQALADPTPAPIAPAEAAAPTSEPITRGKKYPPMSVYVSAEQRKIIEQIAAATGQTKHAVLQYAIRKVCTEWERGQWPDM